MQPAHGQLRPLGKTGYFSSTHCSSNQEAMKNVTQTTKLVTIFALALVLLAAPSFAATAELTATSHQIYWDAGNDLSRADLRISGPDGFTFQKVFAPGESPSFSLDTVLGEIPAGSYTWSLTTVSGLSPELLEAMKAARAAGDTAAIEEMKAAAGFSASRQSGAFYFDGLKLIVPSDRSVSEVDVPTKDQQILDDLIVAGSICAGQDCVNGESFGFDTIRLKENNLRIKAQDTSNSASFPTNDWQITFNDSSNGGKNKFSIDDIDGGRTPFTIEASSPSNSLYVEDGGRIGFGTATPVVELHVVDGNTPTLRLEQDGTSGFTPQTFDVAANEANFFIRDVTNGSKLSFRIRPGAPESSIDIAANGDIGVGTSSPSQDLHIRSTDATETQLLVQNVSTTNLQRVLMKLTNNGTTTFQLEDTGTNERWNTSIKAGEYEISKGGTGVSEMILDGAGNLEIRGGLTANFGTTNDTFPDYVFEEGYDLRTLEELSAFIEAEGHLPGVMSRDEVKEVGGINMTQLQLQMLEKIEELALYTLSQQDLIEKQGALIEELQKQLADQ